MIYAVVGIALVLLIAVALYAIAARKKPNVCKDCAKLEYHRLRSNGGAEYKCAVYGTIYDPSEYCQNYEPRKEDSQ